MHPSDTQPIVCGTDFFEANCIGSHGHSGLLAAVTGSVAHEVIARSCRPVLVVRPPSS